MANFIEADPDIAAFGEDLVWPLASDANGDLKTVAGYKNLESALPFRAITRRGELVHRPDYGIDFEEFENGPQVDEQHAILQARLLAQYGRERRLSQTTVRVTADNERTTARIQGLAVTGQTVTSGVEFVR